MSELSQLGRGQDAAKQPTMHRTPPVTKNYVAAKVKSTKVEGIPTVAQWLKDPSSLCGGASLIPSPSSVQ